MEQLRRMRQWHHDTDEIPVTTPDISAHEDAGEDKGVVRRREWPQARTGQARSPRRRSRGLLAGLALLSAVAAASAVTALGGPSPVMALMEHLPQLGTPEQRSTTSPATGLPNAVPVVPAPSGAPTGSSPDGEQWPDPGKQGPGRKGPGHQRPDKQGPGQPGPGKHDTRQGPPAALSGPAPR